MALRDVNQAGIDLIKSFEKLELKAYQDQAGVWTIGYGHTSGVDENTPDVTPDQAELWLQTDLHNAKNAVCNNIPVELTDNQYAALVSLAFNCGSAPFIGALGKLLNMYHYLDASQEFDRWIHVKIDGVETSSKGLINRRAAEKQLFLTT